MTVKSVSKKKPISLPRLLEKTQKTFNKWVRERDKGLPCISCGAANPEHAGHYFSAGHYSALRFNEVNTNAQCLACNYHKSGNLINYRIGLVRKYGEEKVLLLENSAQLRKVAKWDRYTLEAIIEEYKNK